LRVNMAAADALLGTTAKARSGLPLALIPAVQAEKRKPLGEFILAASRIEIAKIAVNGKIARI